MNDILSLKGIFSEAPNVVNGGGKNLPSKGEVKVDKLSKLVAELNYLHNYWTSEVYLKKAFVSVVYDRVTAKSNRITTLLSTRGVNINETVVGARFIGDNRRKHLITHYVEKSALLESAELLKRCIDILNREFGGIINSFKIDLLSEYGAKKRGVKPLKIDFDSYGISRSRFISAIVDSFYVEKLEVIESELELSGQTMVTLYETETETRELLESLGILINKRRVIDGNTVLLDHSDLMKLQSKVPYLISMAVGDLANYTVEDFEFPEQTKDFEIPEPANEPTIGVIDTLFDENAYFKDWVTYVDKVDADIPRDFDEDAKHGTAVTSLIVDGPSLNPDLDDGCGRFKVRHFGVATGGKFSSFTIMKLIQEIILENKDIKVWNLSLGSDEEVCDNFISVSAALLDKIQYENDIIFVVSGTNKKKEELAEISIGAPADSINSVVVNSVNWKDEPATYSRRGIVLSFFTKPDISYYGGERGNPIRVYTPNGEGIGVGTSYAAPWISRKLSYLIDVLGMSREVAKALIIDSATSFTEKLNIERISYIGHGIVPTHINEIVKTNDDEIRFLMTGKSENYYTYNYNLPIPVNKGYHPFVAKITMCYFPECSRNQGVDYTNSELNLSFGRMKDNGKLNTFNNNFQDLNNGGYLSEENSRANFRKWDNSKHIREVLSTRSRPRKAYSNGLWGISITNKTRLSTNRRGALNFGLVITLKELEGKNRIDEFIRQCSLRGWIVNKVNVENIIDIYNKAESDVEFE